MIGHKPNIFWQVTWRVVSPLIVFVIFVFYLVTKVSETPTYITWNPSSVRSTPIYLRSEWLYDSVLIVIFTLESLQPNFPELAKVPYPDWIYVIIVILAGLPCLLIPGIALAKLFQRRCCCRQWGTEVRWIVLLDCCTLDLCVCFIQAVKSNTTVLLMFDFHDYYLFDISFCWICFDLILRSLLYFSVRKGNKSWTNFGKVLM